MGDKNFISDYMTSVSVIRQFLQEFGVGNLDHNARTLIARLVEKDILCVFRRFLSPFQYRRSEITSCCRENGR